MKGRAILWNADELVWIEAHCTLPRRDLHAAFVARFGRADVAQAAIHGLCKRRRWLTGRTGTFAKGAAPMNKGKRMQFNAASAATWFKKGQRPANKHDIGHETINRDGYVRICVAEPNPWTGAPTHMAFKHRWLWEALNGQVPKGHALKCLDGDRTNTDPANWGLIPVAMLPRLNGRFGRDYDAAPDELKPVIMATTRLEHQARKVRQAAKGMTSGSCSFFGPRLRHRL